MNSEAHVRAIKVAIKRARDAGLKDIRICLPWQFYKHLLAYKGIDWTPKNPEATDQPEDLPIKEIDGHRIEMSARHAAQVLGTKPDGTLSGWAIVVK